MNAESSARTASTERVSTVCQAEPMALAAEVLLSLEANRTKITIIAYGTGNGQYNSKGLRRARCARRKSASSPFDFVAN